MGSIGGAKGSQLSTMVISMGLSKDLRTCSTMTAVRVQRFLEFTG